MTSLRSVALAAIAAVTLVLPGCGSASVPRGDGAWATAPAGVTVVRLVVSPEKEALMRALVGGYNASHAAVSSRRVFVEGRTVSSGAAETEIIAGQLKPTVWSPAGSLWGRLLDFSVDKAYVARENPSIVRTPLVIAMWKPEARALGWPTKKIGFSDLSRLARSPRGWAAYGHPEFGRFALVHTNPDYSTAGLGAVVAEYYAATGKRDDLTAADVARAHSSVQSLEGSIVHYGDTTLFVADHLVAGGPGYASAAIVEESVLLDVNRRLAQAGSRTGSSRSTPQRERSTRIRRSRS